MQTDALWGSQVYIRAGEQRMLASWLIGACELHGLVLRSEESALDAESDIG